MLTGYVTAMSVKWFALKTIVTGAGGITMRNKMIKCWSVAILMSATSVGANAASIYLNDDAGVSVSGALTGGFLSNIINADSATEANPHTQATHAFVSGNGAQMDLRFDLGAVYGLQTAHLWNIDEVAFSLWGVTAMQMEFFDDVLTSLGTYDSPPITSGGDDDPFAEDFDLGGISGVRYVDVLLTGDTSGVDITNFGFTTVPVPTAIWLFGSALGLLGRLKRRST